MRKELRHILVPVDFQPSALDASEYAVRLAKRLNAEVTLLHVLETPGLLSKFFESADLLVKLTDKSKEQLQEMITLLTEKEPGVTINSRVERGKPYERILSISKEINARMIVLGENHQGDEVEQDLGSNVYHVTLKSSVPVITMKGNSHEIGHSIVVPLDLTRETRKQLFSAMVYAMNYGVKVHLVSSLIAGIHYRQSLIYKKLRQARQTLEENGVECEVRIFEKDSEPPHMKVINYADEIGAGMILVMTHQEGYRWDNYIGAFAHHIINRSHVPVLSLTASATRYDYKDLMKAVIDPVGMFFK
jgi:nucleotide-binding universal stress UspA family protein